MDENGRNPKSYEINRKKKAGPNSGGGFAKFLWNSDTKEFCGRTGISWFKITVFYIIFYFFLACFFLLCYYLFSTTLEEGRPRWTGDSNIIGTNPGIGFRPMPDTDKNEMSSLVWINGFKDKTDSEWGTQLDKFLKDKYGLPINKTCSWDGEKADKDGACKVDISTIPECSAGNNMFGYTGGVGTPCVLIKLNKIFDWTPVPYLAKDLKEAEERGMPKFLRDKIQELSDQGKEKELETTWISCEGENLHDKEFVQAANLKYFAPGLGEFPGIPNYYFPYSKQPDGYESPFVFVKFPKLPNDVLVLVECKAWAKNIKANRQDRLGSVHFELLFTNSS